MKTERFFEDMISIKKELEIKKDALNEVDAVFDEIVTNEDKYRNIDEKMSEAYSELSERLLIPLDELENEIKCLYEKYVQMVEVIMKIKDKKQKLLLLLKYIKNMSWDEVAKIMCETDIDFALLRINAFKAANELLELESI